MESTLIRLSGLWTKKDKNGTTYYSGNLGSGRLLLFRNTKKQAEKEPDLVLWLAPPAEKQPSVDQVKDNPQPDAF
jgi:hypothetical protein